MERVPRKGNEEKRNIKDRERARERERERAGYGQGDRFQLDISASRTQDSRSRTQELVVSQKWGGCQNELIASNGKIVSKCCPRLFISRLQSQFTVMREPVNCIDNFAHSSSKCQGRVNHVVNSG